MVHIPAWVFCLAAACITALVFICATWFRIFRPSGPVTVDYWRYVIVFGGLTAACGFLSLSLWYSSQP